MTNLNFFMERKPFKKLIEKNNSSHRQLHNFNQDLSLSQKVKVAEVKMKNGKQFN